MLDGVTGGFGAGTIAARPDPQKTFETLGLTKGGAASPRGVDDARASDATDAVRTGDRQSTEAQGERPPPPPPPSPTGGVEAQSLVQGLLETAETELAQDNAAAAQSLYIAAKDQFLS